ncbi:hypothetical protein [Microbacterium sp. 18062]|uniref:hypothetical protein n=1 Tax=Microbacterium sp. 18062 TaxID=2681410 RepID=UPI00135A0803|nr:hypothetical protein [Microbacterium sp. 18062]
MIGFGGIALIVNFVLDVVLAPGVLPLAVPAALVVSIVVPGVYVAFAAHAIQTADGRVTFERSR